MSHCLVRGRVQSATVPECGFSVRQTISFVRSTVDLCVQPGPAEEHDHEDSWKGLRTGGICCRDVASSSCFSEGRPEPDHWPTRHYSWLQLRDFYCPGRAGSCGERARFCFQRDDSGNRRYRLRRKRTRVHCSCWEHSGCLPIRCRLQAAQPALIDPGAVPVGRGCPVPLVTAGRRRLPPRCT